MKQPRSRDMLILVTLALASVISGVLIGKWKYSPTQEDYRRAEFVGMVEQNLSNAKTDSDRTFYEDWLQDLKERGYMWQESHWEHWGIESEAEEGDGQSLQDALNQLPESSENGTLTLIQPWGYPFLDTMRR